MNASKTRIDDNIATIILYSYSINKISKIVIAYNKKIIKKKYDANKFN